MTLYPAQLHLCPITNYPKILQTYNELQPSPYFRMFQKPVPIANFFPFAAPTVVKLTDQEKQNGRKYNFPGIAVDFESLRNARTIKVLCVENLDAKLPLENSILKVRITQNYSMDKWNGGPSFSSSSSSSSRRNGFPRREDICIVPSRFSSASTRDEVLLAATVGAATA